MESSSQTPLVHCLHLFLLIMDGVFARKVQEFYAHNSLPLTMPSTLTSCYNSCTDLNMCLFRDQVADLEHNVQENNLRRITYNSWDSFCNDERNRETAVSVHKVHGMFIEILVLYSFASNKLMIKFTYSSSFLEIDRYRSIAEVIYREISSVSFLPFYKEFCRKIHKPLFNVLWFQ